MILPLSENQHFVYLRLSKVDSGYIQAFHRRFLRYRAIQAASWGRDDALGGNRIDMIENKTNPI